MPCKPLLTWYAIHHRDLPWRKTNNPYRIWVSEIMLQQTQVKTVLPRYERWFERFPSIADLAKASLDDVLKAWEGLGYYRRARFIHAASQHIMTHHQGHFPQLFEEMLAWPGIGRSTAGAISSFCFHTATPVLDGNVKRVLKRWHREEQFNDKQLWHLAQSAIDQADDAGLWNQAMMELGATLCSVRQPDCAACPVSEHCLSSFDVQESIPTKKVVVKDLYWQVCVYQHHDKGIFLQQRPATGVWAGLWTPPLIELPKKPTKKPQHIHLLTHRRLHLYAHTPSNDVDELEGQWFPSLEQIALPTGIHRLFSAIHLKL
ncbi:MAG: A/G-specific adenine glycosylase [Mariprofundaceae bacterium]|nr:A/G-specific adenine glycosylase [Mariprofundaceae bacterium]